MWNAIHDPTRPVVTWSVHREPGTFIAKEVGDFLEGLLPRLETESAQPHRDHRREEHHRIVVRRVAMDYTIPFTIGRGYCSLPPRRDMAARFRRSGKDKLLLLVLSDFDPEGNDIAAQLRPVDARRLRR